MPLFHQGQCCGCTSPCGYYDCRMHLCKTIGQLWRIRFILYKWVLKGTWHVQGSHNKVERRRNANLELCLYWHQWLGCLGFPGFTLYWQIYSIKAGIRTQEGKLESLRASCTGLSKRETSWVGADGFLVCFAGSCVIQLAIYLS